MRLKQKFPVWIFKNPYNIGIKTGILLGFGSAWVVSSLQYGGTDIVVALAVFVVGSVEYLKEVKKKD